MRYLTLLGIIAILFILIGHCSTASSDANRSYMLPKVIHVVDGDTIKVILPPLKYYPPLDVVSIRINNIDTPESTWRAKCDKEKELGLKAKKALAELVGNRGHIKVVNYKYGTYAGRIVADVYIGGINAGEWLIEHNVAKEYHGRGPKPDWCS